MKRTKAWLTVRNQCLLDEAMNIGLELAAAKMEIDRLEREAKVLRQLLEDKNLKAGSFGAIRIGGEGAAQGWLRRFKRA